MSPSTPRRERTVQTSLDLYPGVSPASKAAFQTRLAAFAHASKPNLSSLSPTTTSPPPPPPPPPPPLRRPLRSLAPPPTTLPELPDLLSPDLLAVFVGFNPGIATSQSGHAYAHPSNQFYHLLHASGCTAQRLLPEEDVCLPGTYSLGNTNLVARPSKSFADLRAEELRSGTPLLEAKIGTYRPEAVCIVGKGIWEAIWKWKRGRGLRKGEFRYGWQGERERLGGTKDWKGAKVFLHHHTSGRAANLSLAEKEEIWAEFGSWVRRRRAEREASTAGVEAETEVSGMRTAERRPLGEEEEEEGTGLA